MSRLCAPAAATSNARLAHSCPFTSLKSGPPGTGARRRASTSTATGRSGGTAVQVPPHRTQRGGTQDREAPDHGGFGCVALRHDQRADARIRAPDRDRKHAAYRSERSVEAQLPQERHPLETGGVEVARGREEPDRHGQIERAAVLADVGGSEVYGDASGGQRKADVAQRRAHALAALPHRSFGQAHDREGGQAGREVHLDADEVGVHAAHGGGGDLGEHERNGDAPPGAGEWADGSRCRRVVKTDITGWCNRPSNT